MGRRRRHRALAQKWNMPMELAVDLATLALYDIIIYAGARPPARPGVHRSYIILFYFLYNYIFFLPLLPLGATTAGVAPVLCSPPISTCLSDRGSLQDSLHWLRTWEATRRACGTSATISARGWQYAARMRSARRRNAAPAQLCLHRIVGYVRRGD